MSIEIESLKAENERLKEKIKRLDEDDFCYEISEIEYQQMQRLKEEISDFISDISTCGFRYDDRCPDNLDELQCCIEDLCNKFDNCKKVLADIKEIAENIVNDNDKPSCVNDVDCPLNGGVGYDNHCNMKCPFILGKQILQKISEVEN